MAKKNHKNRIQAPKSKQGKHIQSSGIPQNNSTNMDYPIFSFECLCSKKYSLDKCTLAEKSSLISKIVELSKITWREIQSLPRHGKGHEKINRASIKANTEGISSDVNFLAFRFSGKKPMVGYRSGRIFYLLWLDTRFNLYEH